MSNSFRLICNINVHRVYCPFQSTVIRIDTLVRDLCNSSVHESTNRRTQHVETDVAPLHRKRVVVAVLVRDEDHVTGHRGRRLARVPHFPARSQPSCLVRTYLPVHFQTTRMPWKLHRNQTFLHYVSSRLAFNIYIELHSVSIQI